MLPVGSQNQAVAPLSRGTTFAACPELAVPVLAVPVRGSLHAMGLSLLQFGTLILLGRLGNGVPPWPFLFICQSIRMPFQFSGHFKSTSLLLGRLAKLLNSAIYIYRVSAERIGLGRESGLADDLLQNPISNRRRPRAATRIPVEGRQRTWPQEL
jgi:hypothetical protein